MPYVLMIHEPIGQRAARTEDEGRATYERMLRFGSDLRAQGLLLAAESLASQEHGKRIKVREGRSQVVDGPFAEAKEMVGGFFLLNCEDREQALAIAAQCPAAEWATVEVRHTSPCYVA